MINVDCLRAKGLNAINHRTLETVNEFGAAIWNAWESASNNAERAFVLSAYGEYTNIRNAILAAQPEEESESVT